MGGPDSETSVLSFAGTLEGKTTFILNGSTVLGGSVVSFLLARGMRLAVHQYTQEGDSYFMETMTL